MKKTSEAWNKIYPIKILDYDGWDRKDLKKSFTEEEITLNEFYERLSTSTCQINVSIFLKIENDIKGCELPALEQVTVTSPPQETNNATIEEIRQAFADYFLTEGCKCCEDDDHKEIEHKLGELLMAEKHSDGSGFNWGKYSSRNK